MTWHTNYGVSCDCGWTPVLNSFSTQVTAEQVGDEHASARPGHSVSVFEIATEDSGEVEW